MRKKSFLICVLTCFCLLTACAADRKPIEEGINSSVSVSESNTDIQDSSVDASVSTIEKEAIPDEVSEEKENLDVYIYSPATQAIAYLDDDEFRNVNLNELLYNHILGAGGGYVYFSFWDEDNINHICAYDLKTEVSKEISVVGNYIQSVDVYEGVLYETEYSYSDGQYFERAFKVGSFEEVSNNQEQYDLLKGYDLCSYNVNSAGNIACIKRIQDNCEYLLVQKDGVIYKYIQGEFFDFIGANNTNNIRYYDDDYVVYSTKTDADDSEALSIYKNQEDKTVFVTAAMGHFLAFEDGVVYYTMDDTSEYFKTVYQMYSYNLPEDRYNMISTFQKSEGIYLWYPGIEGFTINGDYIYVVADDGNDIGVYVLPKDLGEWAEASPTAIVFSTSDYKRFGDVDYISYTHYCNKCGEPLLKYYDEYMVFDDAVSKNAKDINADIRAVAEDSLVANINEISEFEEFDCSEHASSWATTTVDDQLDSVEYIGKNYITINKDGYWYGGGAHGMPLRSHVLFDVRTGERTEFSDLYKGTEEDLKDIVASKVKEDYEAYDDEDRPYFAADSDSAYNDAYSYVSVEYFYGRYCADGIEFEFAPYALGPFAAGYITVFVPYEDLGIVIE